MHKHIAPDGPITHAGEMVWLAIEDGWSTAQMLDGTMPDYVRVISSATRVEALNEAQDVIAGENTAPDQ